MAFSVKSGTIGLSQPSVLDLDKSNEPFSAKIVKICDILGLKLRPPGSYFLPEGTEESNVGRYGPREEWAVRWLLKSFQSADQQPGSPCAEFRAWLLLRELLALTPMSNIARLLNAHKFTATLQKTFNWLNGKSGHIPSLPVSDPHEDATAIADSSSATVEPSPIDQPKKSRKRKRDGSQTSSLKRINPENDIERLYVSICSVIKQLFTLIGTSSEGSLDFATEHLKSAFRSSPEQAAEILGVALRVASHFIYNQQTMILGDSPHYLESEDRSRFTREILRVHEACISAVANIWDSRSVTPDDTLDQLSVLGFSTHALLPILKFIGIYNSLSTSSLENVTTIQALEHLLVKNFILPARASFIGSKSWKKGSGEDKSSLTAELLLCPLAETSNAKSGEFSLISSAELVTSAIPLLFSVAIRSLPRVTPKQRSIEDSWLRHLFSQLEKCTSTIISQIAPNLQTPKYTSIFNRMLREALDHKVRLDDSVSGLILARVLSISNEEFDSADSPLYWTLIGLCLEIDANFFVTSSAVEKSGDGNTDVVVPNKNLAALLSRVTETDGMSTPYSDINYNAKLSKVVLPLAEAFASARDLTAFLFLWEEQLTICQQRRAGVTPKSSLRKLIWEDERLLLLGSRLIESSLTIGQIEQVLQRIYTKLPPSAPVASRTHSESMADLVILDCVVRGMATADALSQIAQSLYVSILGIVSSTSNGPAAPSWRLWRILTTFNERWPVLQLSISCREAERLALHEAVELLNHSVSAEATDVGQVYVQELHAFSFILSAASTRGFRTDGPGPEADRAASVIETILNYRQSLCDSVSLGLMGDPVSSQFTAQWNMQSETIISVDVLLVGCIAQIITFPTVFSNLKADLQLRFFQQLYWSAVAFKKARQPETGFINYPTLWHTWLDSELLRENAAVATLFRNFHASVFLAASDVHGQILDAESYDLAFGGIRRTPVRAFDRGQRNRILDGILGSISCTNLTTSTILDHVGLLIEYIGVCNNPSRVLCVIQKDSTRESLQQFPLEQSPLLKLARRLDRDQVSMSKMPALKALKKLGHSTLRRCISAISQEKNVECLASFYDQLIKAGTDDFQNPSHYALTTILETSLSFFVDHVSEFPESLRTKADRVKSLRQHHVQILCQCLSRIHGDKCSLERPTVRSEMLVVLEGMISYSDLLAHPRAGEISNLLSEISEVLQTANLAESSKNLEDESVSSDHLLIQIARLETLWGVSNRNLRPAVLQVIGVLRTLKLPSDRKRLLYHLQHTLTAAEPEERTEFLRMLVNIETGECLDPESLLLLQQVVLAQEDSKPRLEPYAIELAQACTALCHGLVQSTKFRHRVLTMQSLSLLLQKEPRTISQWHIDSLLAGIAIVSSRLVGTNEGQSTGVAFLGLCRLFSMILVLHRVKLGGRYHLVVAALQGLLRCLFVSYPTSSATWTASESVSALGEAHAAAYGRLLSTICDPTVSAVTRPGKASRRGLTDETKKARRMAGQHVQYVVMEYCHCQLTGRLQPAMKAALAPGLYAMFEVMSHEVMRTMNEAMDSSCRSIFKALYEEHGRVAKRQGV